MFRRNKGLTFERFFRPGERIMRLATKNVIMVQETDLVEHVVPLLLGGPRKIPVVKKGKLQGLITATDLLDYCGAGDRHQDFRKRKKPLKAQVGRIMSTQIHTLNSTDTMKKAFQLFIKHGHGSYPILERGRVVGMVSDWDFLKRIKGDVGVKVRDLMIKRPARAKEHFPILDVAKIMVKGGYRRLPITRWGILTGIVLPYDILSFLKAEGGLHTLSKELRPVKVAMRKDVITINPKDDIGLAVTKMLQSRVGGLPVVEDQELVGILTESDIVQGLLH